MELFTARVCPYAHRTRLALLEKGLEFEHIEVDFNNKSERFLAISPYGKVPALVHDGNTIYESAIINEYLEEVFGEPSLMPNDPVLRARIRIWIGFCDEYFTDDHYALLRNQDPARVGELRDRVTAHMRFVEHEGLAKLSSNGPYWLGTRLSLLDLAWYPFFERLPAWTHYRGLEVPADCPRLAAWLESMARLDSVKQLRNDADYYIEHYVGYAKEVLAA